MNTLLVHFPQFALFYTCYWLIQAGSQRPENTLPWLERTVKAWGIITRNRLMHGFCGFSYGDRNA